MSDSHAGPLRFTKKVTGPGSASVKYDLLTALLVTAAQGDPVVARLALRLSLLITARFNWRMGTFSVGQREMARMWGVTERTAKREIAQMRTRKWIVIAVPPARGRVAQYRIDLQMVLRDTITHWDAVGPDFAARMSGAPEPYSGTETNVVPLHPAATELPAQSNAPAGWDAAMARLKRQDPAVYTAWFAPLKVVDLETGVLTLSAPSPFHADYIRTHFHMRLLAAIVSENREIREVLVIAG